MIQQVLEEIGLTGNETKIYMCLLNNGECTTGEIYKKTDVKTGKIYDILESLKKKGLISEVIKSRVKHYNASDPKNLFEYLEEKQKNINNQKQELQKVLPEILSKLKEKKSKTNIEIYLGFQGLKTAFSKEIDYMKNSKKNKTLYVIGIQERKMYPKEVYDFFVFNQQPKRAKFNVKVKKILGESARGDKDEQGKNVQIRFLPYGSTVSINIIGELSIIAIFAEQPIYIVIENKDAADNFIDYFNFLWKIAKK